MTGMPPRRETHYFAGARDESATPPEWFISGTSASEDAFTPLETIIKDLPEAESAPAAIINPHSVDGELPPPEQQLTLTDIISGDDPKVSPDRSAVTDYQWIIDPRRAKLAADGRNVDYVWQIASDEYSIIQPEDSYSSMLDTLCDRDYDSEIFGEVKLDDYGGNVYIRLVHPSMRLEDIDGEGTDIVYGHETGYSHTGQRAFYSRLIAYETEFGTIMPRIGQRRKQVHRGEPDSEIAEWWEKDIDQLEAMTDPVSANIKAASELKQPFASFTDDTEPSEGLALSTDEIGTVGIQKPYSIKQFFEGLALPSDVSKAAATFLKAHGRHGTEPTFWDLYKAAHYGIGQASADAKVSTRTEHARRVEKFISKPGDPLVTADKGWNIQCDSSPGAPGGSGDELQPDADSPLAMLTGDAEAPSLTDKYQERREIQANLSELEQEFAPAE